MCQNKSKWSWKIWTTTLQSVHTLASMMQDFLYCWIKAPPALPHPNYESLFCGRYIASEFRFYGASCTLHVLNLFEGKRGFTWAKPKRILTNGYFLCRIPNWGIKGLISCRSKKQVSLTYFIKSTLKLKCNECNVFKHRSLNKHTFYWVWNRKKLRVFVDFLRC